MKIYIVIIGVLLLVYSIILELMAENVYDGGDGGIALIIRCIAISFFIGAVVIAIIMGLYPGEDQHLIKVALQERQVIIIENILGRIIGF